MVLLHLSDLCYNRANHSLYNQHMLKGTINNIALTEADVYPYLMMPPNFSIHSINKEHREKTLKYMSYFFKFWDDSLWIGRRTCDFLAVLRRIKYFDFDFDYMVLTHEFIFKNNQNAYDAIKNNVIPNLWDGYVFPHIIRRKADYKTSRVFDRTYKKTARIYPTNITLPRGYLEEIPDGEMDFISFFKYLYKTKNIFKVRGEYGYGF